MPKVNDPAKQATVAVKKYAAAAAAAVRAVTTEHTEGQDAHVVKAVKSHSKVLISNIKGSVNEAAPAD